MAASKTKKTARHKLLHTVSLTNCTPAEAVQAISEAAAIVERYIIPLVRILDEGRKRQSHKDSNTTHVNRST